MRLTPVYRPADYAGDPAEIAALFNRLFPGIAEPAIDRGHAGLAVAALNPQLALRLAELSRFLALETGFGGHADLRELAIQAVNLRYGQALSFEARLGAAQAAGLGPAQLAAIPLWRTTTLLSEEQRLVVEYAEAVVAGEVPAPLFARVVAAFGERQAVELTSIVGFWAFWAMLLNATRPEGEPGEA